MKTEACIRIISLMTVFMVCFVGIYGQDLSDSNYFLKAFRINAGIGYDRYDDVGYYRFNELTWLSQVSVSLTRGLYLGIVLNSIYTRQTGMPNENYFLKGAFVQYDLTKKRKMMTFLELTYMQGDYCTCKNNEPFRQSGLHYIGFGPGFEYPILNSSFYGSASFIIHRILGDVEEKHNYNIPTLGLSYRFGKPKRVAQVDPKWLPLSIIILSTFKSILKGSFEKVLDHLCLIQKSEISSN